MEKAPYAWITSHGCSQTGKALEQVNVVEKSRRKPLGGFRMLFPRPGKDLFEVC
jgi:hypothetical protein